MNKAVKYTAIGAGAFTLFAGSFLSFAALSGRPMNEIAVVGELFEQPEAQLEPEQPNSASEVVDERPPEKVIETASAPLQAFILQQPFSTEELEELQRELKASRRKLEGRERELDAREEEIAARESQLADQLEHLVKIRTELHNDSMELEQRKVELVRDEKAQKEREDASWASLAQVFAEGKTSELAQILVLSTPEDAARILRALPSERATELLREIDRSKFLEYSEAYRKAEL